MKYLTITALIVFAFGTLLVVVEQRGAVNLNGLSTLANDGWAWPQTDMPSTPRPLTSSLIRATGKIEGLTESIELKSRIAEQIRDVHAVKGMWVSQGDVLISLDTEHLLEELNLAKAMVKLAIAKKNRLEEGARSSEIEAAKKDYESNLAPLWSAERALERALKLYDENAIGQQDLDDVQAASESLRATTEAALARLKTVELPAHKEDVSAADAEVQAAQSRLRIAQIRLERSQIRAPIDGRLLDVNAKIGELTGPQEIAPLVVMVDNRQLHAVAEVDEFDALKVQIGQRCEITSDAYEGILAVGSIVEIEPQMDRKQFMSQRAEERHDTFSRIVRIALDKTIEDLPIGLPIEISVQPVETQSQ